MALKSGFYNAKYSNGTYDRAYDADDLSIIAAMLVNDGIFVAETNHFQVIPGTGLAVVIAAGRAWFRSKWLYNDASVTITLPSNPVLSPRWDAIIIDLDLDQTTDNGRMATFKVISSPESQSPVKPVHSSNYPNGGTYTVDNRQVTYLAYNGSTHFQYPLAYVYRTPAQSSITTGNITSVVGLSTYKVPGVTAIVDPGSKVQELYDNWQVDWTTWKTARDTEYTTWITNKQDEFDTWFESIQDTIEGDSDAIVSLTGKMSTAEGNIMNLQRKVGSDSNGYIVLNSDSFGTGDPPSTTQAGRLYFKYISG